MSLNFKTSSEKKNLKFQIFKREGRFTKKSLSTITGGPEEEGGAMQTSCVEGLTSAELPSKPCSTSALKLPQDHRLLNLCLVWG